MTTTGNHWYADEAHRFKFNFFMCVLPVSRPYYRLIRKILRAVAAECYFALGSFHRRVVLRSPAFIIFLCLCLTGCAPDKQKHFAVGAAASGWVYSETGDRSLACLAALGAGVAKKS